MLIFTRFLLFFVFTSVLLSCKKTRDITANEFVEASINAHGMEDFNKKVVEFVFRKHRYTQNKDLEGLIFARRKIMAPDTIDFLHSKNGFSRTFKDKLVVIPDSLSFVYRDALNSVLYFFRLPYVLIDKGAIKTLMKIEKIKGVTYQKIKVSFTEENGGVDHQDNFLYWFNKKTKTLDYLAYRYYTNNGGVRFRVAVNKRTIDGVIFQDYENYSAPKNTRLDEFPRLYSKGKLELISMIENNSIKILNP